MGQWSVFLIFLHSWSKNRKDFIFPPFRLQTVWCFWKPRCLWLLESNLQNPFYLNLLKSDFCLFYPRKASFNGSLNTCSTFCSLKLQTWGLNNNNKNYKTSLLVWDDRTSSALPGLWSSDQPCCQFLSQTFLSIIPGTEITCTENIKQPSGIVLSKVPKKDPNPCILFCLLRIETVMIHTTVIIGKPGQSVCTAGQQFEY